LETLPAGKGRLPDRLIHASVLRRDLIERLKRLPVVLDVQPRFVAGDFPWVMDRLGPELSPCAYAFKTMLREGLVCAGGSDAPIEPMNPLLGIHAAVTRRPPGGEGPPEGYFPGERLTPREALTLFTKGSAFAAGEERERGTLSIGKWADVTVFDRNPLETDPEDLLKARVVLTLVNGRIGYGG
ncbi:MAG: amidohydrolase, partial [Thermoactinomycetaceae bacterium]|nr:amidohydrolase [Thermoactinomycetaceae bacterium]